VTGRAEHHIRSMGSSLRSVTSQILGSDVSFRLNNPAGQNILVAPMHEQLAEQLLGNVDGRLLVK
jgi:hypothetical protein